MRRSLNARSIASVFAAALCATLFGLSAPASATPALTMDLGTGEVLYQQDATEPWFPASTTKLMTVYVALAAVRDHKIAMDTPLVYSARARMMPASKMGFQLGTQVTLENALRMLMVKSANDVAVTVAEGVSGSVEAFADDMNRAATTLGLHESHFVNPNGLPASDHVSSARDMALIARALYVQFPQEASLFDIGALSLGPQLIGNHNNLLGRYPGADGMKTGFTCAAGFNVVASAFRDGRRVIVVVFGAPSVATRTAKVVALFDRAFANIDRPTGSIVALRGSGQRSAPDMHNAVCRNRAPLIARFNSEVAELDAPLTSQSGALGLLNPERALLFNGASPAPMATRIASMPRPVFDPVAIHIGADPGYQGPVAQARAPHSPIGTESAPASVEAYAPAPETSPQGVGIAPLAVDPNALPLKGRHVRAAARRHHGRALALKAAAEAPETKIISGAEGDEGAPAKRPVTKSAATKTAGKTKTASVAKTPSVAKAPSAAKKKHAADEADETKSAPEHSGKPSPAKSSATKSSAGKTTASTTKAAAKKTKSAEDE